MPTIDTYIALVPSANRQKPRFIATLTAILQPFVDMQNQAAALPAKFDVDSAVGQQLDFVGEWVGFSRNLPQPITDVYFSFDTAGLGFDEGVIFGPGDPLEGLVRLDDETYRLMIKAKIAANHWDGSLEGAQEALQLVFANSPGTYVFIEDNFDMTMDIGIVGIVPSTLFTTLIEDGYLPLRPAAVKINAVTVDPGPLFGFDSQNYAISGFDTGVIT